MDESWYERIPQLAEEAMEAYKQEILQAAAQCEIRRQQRGFPVLALVGPSRAGKDFGAEFLQGNYDVEYSGSMSKIISPLVAKALGKSVEEVYATRHTDKQFWFEFCNALRAKSPELLVRWSLARGDIVVGVRASAELEAAVAERLVDLTVFIDNPRVPEDPTLEYDASDCDLVLPNHAGKLEYLRRLRKLAGLLGIPKR